MASPFEMPALVSDSDSSDSDRSGFISSGADASAPRMPLRTYGRQSNIGPPPPPSAGAPEPSRSLSGINRINRGAHSRVSPPTSFIQQVEPEFRVLRIFLPNLWITFISRNNLAALITNSTHFLPTSCRSVSFASLLPPMAAFVNFLALMFFTTGASTRGSTTTTHAQLAAILWTRNV